MTVGELLFKLTELEDEQLDYQVVMSKDAEGNSFSPLDEIVVGAYTPDSTWSGEFTDIEMPAGSTNAVCLWPVN